ncbi:MAG: DUF2065 domain-containing protein [Alphaproteobacteria bacterium]|nr:DUF2065 domain-containing protein [Alphaproteobacteria bacterium]
MSLFLIAFGLMLVMEGVLYALFPGAMKRMMARLQEQPESTLRWSGLALAVIGFALVWLVRG